jgi:hypothetical protein
MKNENNRLTESANAADFTIGSLHCRLLPTADGSFSLCYGDTPDQLTEPMHSSKGAWSETLLIYEPAMIASISLRNQNSGPWSVASVGLGLGYNEILAAGLSLQKKMPPSEVNIYSFESRPELRDAFRKHFTFSEQSGIPSELAAVYDNITERTASRLALEPHALRQSVRDLILRSSLVLNGAVQLGMSEKCELPSACQCILFDAFSPASSPDLWSESLLTALIVSLSGRNCVFSSYASRTVLKRILKKHGFILEKRSGFAGKRESTFAVRKEL